MNGRSLLSIGVAGIALASFAFEKIALIDSLDEAQKWDVETPGGTLKVVEDALRPHSTRVLWRDKGASLMRSAEARCVLGIAPRQLRLRRVQAGLR